MTYEEQQQYNKLSYAQQKEYDGYKSIHPTWTHKQIMFKIAMDKKIGDLPPNVDPDPDDPEILAEILKGAKLFLIGVGIIIYEVFDAIDDMLDTLGDLISRGVRYIGDRLEEFWEWLTN